MPPKPKHSYPKGKKLNYQSQAIVKQDQDIDEAIKDILKSEGNTGASTEPKYEESLTEKEKNLDNLARLLVGDEVCTAVYLYNGKLLIASNHAEPNYARKYLKYLQEYFRAPYKPQYEQLIKKAYDYIIDIIKDLEDLNDNTENIGDSKNQKDKYYHSLLIAIKKSNIESVESHSKMIIENKSYHQNSEARKLAVQVIRPIIDTYLITNAFESKKVSYSAIINIIKKNNITYVSGIHNKHAEMKIMDEDIGSTTELTYLGISKLTCWPCYASLVKYKEVKGVELRFSGTHGGTYPGWLAPNWVLREDSNFLQSFLAYLKENPGAHPKILKETYPYLDYSIPSPPILSMFNNEEEFGIKKAELMNELKEIKQKEQELLRLKENIKKVAEQLRPIKGQALKQTEYETKISSLKSQLEQKKVILSSLSSHTKLNDKNFQQLLTISTDIKKIEDNIVREKIPLPPFEPLNEKTITNTSTSAPKSLKKQNESSNTQNKQFLKFDKQLKEITQKVEFLIVFLENNITQYGDKKSKAQTLETKLRGLDKELKTLEIELNTLKNACKDFEAKDTLLKQLSEITDTQNLLIIKPESNIKKTNHNWYEGETIKGLLKSYLPLNMIYLTESLALKRGFSNTINIDIDNLDTFQEALQILVSTSECGTFILYFRVDATSKELNSSLEGSIQQTSHWVGLYLTKNSKNAMLEVTYIDPMEHPMSKQVMDALELKLGTIDINQPLNKIKDKNNDKLKFISSSADLIDQDSGLQFSHFDAKEETVNSANNNAASIQRIIGIPNEHNNQSDCGPFLVFLMILLNKGSDLNLDTLSKEKSKFLGQKLREHFKNEDNIDTILQSFNSISQLFTEENVPKGLEGKEEKDEDSQSRIENDSDNNNFSNTIQLPPDTNITGEANSDYDYHTS